MTLQDIINIGRDAEEKGHCPAQIQVNFQADSDSDAMSINDIAEGIYDSEDNLESITLRNRTDADENREAAEDCFNYLGRYLQSLDTKEATEALNLICQARDAWQGDREEVLR